MAKTIDSLIKGIGVAACITGAMYFISGMNKGHNDRELLDNPVPYALLGIGLAGAAYVLSKKEKS
ncbi:MAG TPA: hypothetical protein VJH65_03940 [Candidatus Nanoarchaeia archaeon]|nr:hypothetical protein [Candidatus Nanoarchaeia archaeon]